jgi:hypothetical protein
MKATALFILITASSAMAQQTDSLNTKHELHFDVRPGLIFLLGADDKAPSYGFTYKFSPDGKGAWRAGFRYVDTWNTSTYKVERGFDESAFVVETYHSYSGPGFQGSAGYEWIKGQKRLKAFYGADIAYRRYSSVMTKGTFYYAADSCSTCLPGQIPVDPVRSYGEYIKSTTDRYQLSLFCGLKYPVWKRLMISAQAGIGVMYETGRSRSTFSNNSTPASYRFSGWNIADMPFVNDVSVAYKF